MNIFTKIAEAQAACRILKQEGKRLGLVPTMGALHAGHLSLVRTARTQSDVVAASIFVNPLQFGPNEDFSRYPRSFECDLQLLQEEGTELVFAPTVEEMYPPPPGAHSRSSCATSTFVEVASLTERLEGKSRPGHFRGVTTVVSKLFHILDPALAFFGQKDAQQAVIIRRMVRDLNLPVEVIVCPTVREPDGLAMSSRNAYLDPPHRKAATVLYRALMRVQILADTGEREATRLAEAGREIIREEPLARLDHLEIVHPETLEPVSDISGGALVVTAAYFANTRLIDNVMLHSRGHLPVVSGQ
jgi:pantoate--beta-alanine ligase